MVTDVVLQKSTVIFFHQSSEPDDSSWPPHGGLGQVLAVFCFIKFAFVWGEIQVTICSHPRLVPCGLHNVEAPAETGFHGDGKGGLEGLVG